MLYVIWSLAWRYSHFSPGIAISFLCFFVCLFVLSFSSHSIIINKKLGLHNKQLFNISFLEEISLIYKIIPNNNFIIQKIETDLFYQWNCYTLK